MSGQPAGPQPVPATSARSHLRIEYLGFEDVDLYRHFRFRVYASDGYGEFRMRVAHAAFDERRVRMQDCPDLCYQRLLQVVDGGSRGQVEVITIEDADLVTYRTDHTAVPKRRARTMPDRPTPPPPPERRTFRATPAKAAAPPPVPAAPTGPAALEEGQRVRHAQFGMGVTEAGTPTRTVVWFDQDGRRSFVRSMIELEVLSAPRTWETSRRGQNRPRTAADVAADAAADVAAEGPTPLD